MAITKHLPCTNARKNARWQAGIVSKQWPRMAGRIARVYEDSNGDKRNWCRLGAGFSYQFYYLGYLVDSSAKSTMRQKFWFASRDIIQRTGRLQAYHGFSTTFQARACFGQRSQPCCSRSIRRSWYNLVCLRFTTMMKSAVGIRRRRRILHVSAT